MKKLWTLVALCAATIATPALAQVAQVQPTLGLDRAGDCRRLTVYDAAKGGSDKTVAIGCLDSASAWKAAVPTATTTVAGVMSAADKAKLDGIAAGASVRSVAVSSASGIAASITNATSTPSISLSLSAITPTTVAATGSLSGTGVRATGDIDSAATASGGPGLELTYLAGQGFGRLFAYNRTAGTRLPFALDGSQIQLRINGTTKITLDPTFGNYASDAAAAAAGVPVNGLYRTGSQLMIRTS